MQLPIPNFPLCPEKPLVTKKYNAGALLIAAKSQETSEIPKSYSNACNTLDALREYLRVAQEFKFEEENSAVQYFNLLQLLLGNEDLSKYNIGYTYNSTTISSIKFELCCIFFNTGLNLLKGLHRFAANANYMFEYIKMIEFANELLVKAHEFYDESFIGAIPLSVIDNALSYSRVCWAAAKVPFALKWKEEKFKVTSKFAMATSIHMGKANPPLPFHEQYYKSLAMLYLAMHYNSTLDDPECLQLVNRAFEGIPDMKTLNKNKKDPHYKDWVTYLEAAEPVRKYYVEFCEKHGTLLPRGLVDVPSAKLDEVQTFVKNWNEFPKDIIVNELKQDIENMKNPSSAPKPIPQPNDGGNGIQALASVLQAVAPNIDGGAPKPAAKQPQPKPDNKPQNTNVQPIVLKPDNEPQNTNVQPIVLKPDNEPQNTNVQPIVPKPDNEPQNTNVQPIVLKPDNEPSIQQLVNTYLQVASQALALRKKHVSSALPQAEDQLKKVLGLRNQALTLSDLALAALNRKKPQVAENIFVQFAKYQSALDQAYLADQNLEGIVETFRIDQESNNTAILVLEENISFYQTTNFSIYYQPTLNEAISNVEDKIAILRAQNIPSDEKYNLSVKMVQDAINNLQRGVEFYTKVSNNFQKIIDFAESL